MSRNGSGVYNLPAGQPVVSGTVVSSTVFNAFTADIAIEMTKSVASDGQTPMGAQLNMGTNKIKNLASGTLSNDAVNYGQMTTAISGGTVAIAGIANSLNTGNSYQVSYMNVNGTYPLGSISGSGSTWARVTMGCDATATNMYFLCSNVQTSQLNANLAGISVYRPLTMNISTGVLTLDGTGAGTTFGGNVTMPSYTITSDRRLKSKIKIFSKSGAILDKINVYSYLKKDRFEYGVIAQELKKAAPKLVHKNDDGLLSVDYNSLFAVVMAEVKDLRHRVAMLEGSK